jgi:hypothetical protein
VTGVEKSATTDVVKQAPFDAGPVKVKVRLADAIKVGKEGYIHGFICVRPPCGKYSEAVHNTANGKVTHEDAKIGQQLKKEAGDSGYSIAHLGPAGKVKLGGQYNTRHDAAGAVALYHNTSVLHDAASGDAKAHLASAKAALGSGDHEAALKHLESAHIAAASAGDASLAEHIKSTRVSLTSHPHPTNAPSHSAAPVLAAEPLKAPAAPEHPAEKLPEVAPAPAVPQHSTPEQLAQTDKLSPADRKAYSAGRSGGMSHDEAMADMARRHELRTGTPFGSQGSMSGWKPVGGVVEASKPATPEPPAISSADEVKQLPHHQQEAYRFRTANGMDHGKALAYAKFVPEPGATQAAADPYAGMSSHAKNIMMGIQGGKVSTGSHGTSGPPMKSKVGSVQDAQRAEIAHMAPLSHGVGDPEGQKVGKATGEVRFGYSNGLVGHVKKVPGGHQAISAKTGEVTAVHPKRVDALIELAGFHNKKIDEERAASDAASAPAAPSVPSVSSPPPPSAAPTPAKPRFGKKVTTYELKPGDRVIVRDEPNLVRTVKTQHAGIVNFEDGGKFFPQGMGVTLHRAPEEGGASAAGKKVSVKNLPAGVTVHESGRTDYADRPIKEVHLNGKHIADLTVHQRENWKTLPSGVRYGTPTITNEHHFQLTDSAARAAAKDMEHRQQGHFLGSGRQLGERNIASAAHEATASHQFLTDVHGKFGPAGASAYWKNRDKYGGVYNKSHEEGLAAAHAAEQKAAPGSSVTPTVKAATLPDAGHPDVMKLTDHQRELYHKARANEIPHSTAIRFAVRQRPAKSY